MVHSVHGVTTAVCAAVVDERYTPVCVRACVFLRLAVGDQVVVLVTEGSEESKLRNSNSKSKSITKALQTRKDKFDMYGGDDPMVPPGPRPRMVKQEMVIMEYHLSQVLSAGV